MIRYRISVSIPIGNRPTINNLHEIGASKDKSIQNIKFGGRYIKFKNNAVACLKRYGYVIAVMVLS